MKKALALIALMVCAFAVSAQIMYQTPSGDAYVMLSMANSNSITLTDAGGSYTFTYRGVSSKDSNTLIYSDGSVNVYIDVNLTCFTMFSPNGQSMFFVKSSTSSYTPAPSYSAPSYSSPRPEICYTCHGTGACPVCRGSGIYSMYGYSSTCTACGGTGKCWHCHGSGRQ